MIAQFITLRYAMNWELFVIKDELRVQTRIEAARVLFGLAAKAIGSLISIVAVAAVSIVEGVFAIALYGRHIDRLIDAREREMFDICVEALLVTIAAVLPSAALMVAYDWSPHDTIALDWGQYRRRRRTVDRGARVASTPSVRRDKDNGLPWTPVVLSAKRLANKGLTVL